MSEVGYASTDYVTFSADELNSILKKLWFEVRRKPKNDDDEPEHYSKATLQNIRHAINRILQENGHEIDITSDLDFKELNKAYIAACKELKQIGKAVVKSYEEILHTGNNKYKHIITNTIKA